MADFIPGNLPPFVEHCQQYGTPAGCDEWDDDTDPDDEVEHDEKFDTSAE